MEQLATEPNSFRSRFYVACGFSTKSPIKEIMAAVTKAFSFYLFLVFIVRIVGRRPGKQITPFEFVLVFFMGGLALTAMVGDDASLTNALLQIITLAFAHYGVAFLRSRSRRIARLFDGTPLILLEEGLWRSNTLSHMGIQDDDVMATARDQGILNLDQIDQAILERNGEISIIKKESK
jgi:uncharacterized membrane protein YcaP (DUF421 family)